MEKPQHRTSWWARQSLLRKTLFILILVVLIIALALGLGLGLGLGGNGGGGGGEEPSPTTSPTAPPTPPGNGTWQPAVNSTWQIILQNPVHVTAANTSLTPDVDVWDIDMFSNTNTTISALHDLGKKVICYFSAGSSEDWRPDFDQFQPDDMGHDLDGWPGERWLDLNSQNVRNIMTKRIQLAAQKGCDAIDPDNIDGYDNDNGLGLTSQDSVDYMSFLSATATNLSLAIGLKNAGEIIPEVLNMTHFSVNEQCVENDECDTFSPYVQAGKPVFHIEYPAEMPHTPTSSICSNTGDSEGSTDFSTVLKKMDLDGWVELCNGLQVTTPMVPASD
ncbi:glycoside hydrolase family 114 protein [Saccharata proteae CBS 121410]|uniref:alpha-galactosidase n=1 Tax=Saccharata proteae CBS 121410 TaxID=1314787 RepID=A0A6A5YDZ2_9PEZI|nr:glycoside hydrolase family 114 protein [Saccharata proteae CBS 121410]